MITGATAENGEVMINPKFFGQLGSKVSGKGIDFTIGEPKVTYTTGYEEFCEDEIIPCPDYAAADALSDVLEDYALEQYKYVESIVIKAPEVVVNVASEAAVLLFELLMQQLEIAATAYVFYQCVSLWFPAPLFLFRSNVVVATKRFLFGSQKIFFMAIVLAIWWGWSYLQTFQIPAILSVHLDSFLKDPCLADPGYVIQVGQEFSEVCDELTEMQSNWKIETETIKQILSMVELMTECSCDFPFKHLRQLMPITSDEVDRLKSLGFGRLVEDGLCNEFFSANDQCKSSMTVCWPVSMYTLVEAPN